MRTQLPFVIVRVVAVRSYAWSASSQAQPLISPSVFFHLQRTARLTIMEACVFVGSAAGAGVGSVLTQHFNVAYALGAMIFLCVINLILAVFFLREGRYLHLAHPSTPNGKPWKRVCESQRSPCVSFFPFFFFVCGGGNRVIRQSNEERVPKVLEIVWHLVNFDHVAYLASPYVPHLQGELWNFVQF